nr:3',5'-nucleoside bisphosphate phosphatase [Cupriavidus sp.]
MVPHDRNVDLHMHSSASDGVLSPRDLVARGAANGLEVMALTDHDTLDGLSEAAEAATDLGIRFVPGVEVSVTWAGETLHVLGLGVNPKAPSLAGALREMQRSRGQRADQMDDALVAAGLPSVLSQALGYAGNPLLVGRTHFARALVARGVCGQIQEVFDRYLTPGKPGYVVHHWARLSEAMAWIQEAGGTPVLAHPARYRLSETARWALLQEFRTLGGQAIEVSTGSHSKEDTRRYQQIALQWGMKASRGSDFHSPTESRCDVGRAPPLPDGCDPVWAYW